MTERTKRLSSRPWERLKRRVLADTDICHICGHHGADTADHVVPIARGGTNAITNLKPAHHNACATCGNQCNRIKNGKEYAPIVRDSGTLRRPQ